MSNDFGTQLRHLRLLAGWTTRELAARAHMDPTYVTRIEEGRRPPPSRPFVERLAQVLPLATTIERDQFYAGAGLLPPGGWDSSMTTLRTLLARPELTPAARAQFLAAMGIAFARAVYGDARRQDRPVLLHERQATPV